ncbi:MAG: orotidine-5'-phosphate decarboxylase [Phycisphaerae bacterium]
MAAEKNFADRLARAIKEKNTPLIVGLDPVYENLPPAIISRRGFDDGNSCAARIDALSEFGRKIIHTVSPYVPAVKINIAYFERYLWEGVEAYYNLIQEANGYGLLVIGDVKRGDVGHTSTQYALGDLADCDWDDAGATLGPDAITINSYFGLDGITPFMDVAKASGKGAFALLRTSNASAGQIQEIPAADGRPMFLHIAEMIENWGSSWRGECGFSNLGAVVGATSGDAIGRIRRTMPHTIFLIPGIGAQGGSLADCAPAFRPDGLGAIISASRSVIFAHRESRYAHIPAAQWTSAVQQAVLETKAYIAQAIPAFQ